MKIAFVVTDLSPPRIGGISRVATEIARHLVDLGHEVHAYVLYRKDHDQPVSRFGIHMHYINPGIRLNPDYPVIAFSYAAFAQLAQDNQLQTYDIIQSFNLNSIALPRYARQIRQQGSLLVQANFETLSMDIQAKWQEFRQTPAGSTLMQILVEQLLAWGYEKSYLHAVDCLITEDQNTCNALREMNISGEKIYQIPSGVDVNAAQQSTAPEIDRLRHHKGPVIGYIGRVDPRKGVQYLIQAFKKFHQRYPDSLLFLAGGSRQAYNKVIQKQIQDFALENAVILLGRIEGSILPYYKLADILVIPSLSEGIPITMMEGMASGVPLVVSNLPGITAFIGQEPYVYWSRPADPDSIYQALDQALQQPRQTLKMVLAAENFAATFSWLEVAKRYLNVYQEIIKTRLSSKKNKTID